MNKIINSKHRFSQGVLSLHYELLPQYKALTVKGIDLWEYDPLDGSYGNSPLYSSEDGEFELANSPEFGGTEGDIVLKIPELNASENHLLKCRYVIGVPTGYNGSSPCCIDQSDDGKEWYEYEYFVDLSVYEKNLLESINLGCNNCDVPLATVDSLLRFFSIVAAADSDSPSLEMFFQKIACRNYGYVTPSTHHSNCNCNG